MAKREIPEINAGSMADIAFLLLIFFLVTTTMDKDQAYVRNIPKLIVNAEPPIDVENRNICEIKANNRNQLMFRGEIMQDPDKISEKIVEFYEKNEKVNDVTNNFPLYSRISLEEVETSLSGAIAAAEETENTDNVLESIVEFKWAQVSEWEKKKKSLQLYGKAELPEIHFQAHVRIVVQKGTSYELFAKIQSETEEAIFELRNKASMQIFDESYETLSKRLAMDKSQEDKEKMELLKILYPDRIIEVTPK